MAISGNYMLRRPKRSKNEVVAPKEKEEYYNTPEPTCFNKTVYIRLFEP
jgi:hypothetical protein